MMKTLKRLWPDSMLRQLVLVTVLGILILQVVNYYGVCNIQGIYSDYVDRNRAETAAAYYMLLKNMRPDERAGAIEGKISSGGLSPASLAVAIKPYEPQWTSSITPITANTASLLRESVAGYGYDQPGGVKVRIIDEKSVADEMPSGLSDKFPLLQTALRLEADNWLVITQPLLNDDQKLIWTQRLTLLMQLLIFSGVIIAILMRVTDPLCRLTQAAELFGRQPETQCPLPLAGSKEVREAAVAFNRMRERICDNIAERQRMFAAVGHDLRTPLTRAKLRLDEIEPENLRTQFAGNLAEIQSIVEQGLELAESLSTSEKEVPLDIRSFVQSLAEDAADQGQKVVMEETAPADPMIVSAKPVCLKRCLENLISNALKYGGDCRIAISRRSKDVIIEVMDSGPGLPDDYLERVFEPYFRMEGSRNRTSGGIGLGLSIARNMCALNNGRLALKNRPEGGLTAKLTLSALEMSAKR